MYDIEGTRFTLMGSWDGRPEPVDRVVLRVVPDNGATYALTNASTAAMLVAMERADLDGKSVLDFGTGSGVLALAARALGASDVTLLDHNPQALASAMGTLQVNNAAWAVDTHILIDDDGQHYDVILANIGDGDLVTTLIDRCDLLIASCPKARKRVSGGRGEKPVYTRTVKDIKQRLIDRGRSPQIVDLDPEWSVVVG